MKVTLYMAMSINGYIADSNGNEDFLSDHIWTGSLNILKESHVVLWGKKAYENFLKWPGKYLQDVEGINIFVLTKNKNYEVKEGFSTTSSPEEFLSHAKIKRYKKVIIDGGAQTNESFLRKGLIDEIILNIESVLIGSGIPLLSYSDLNIKLELIKLKTVNSNIVQIHYKVIK